MPLFPPQSQVWALYKGDPALYTAATLSANRAYFVGVWLPTPAVLTALRVYFGAGSSGHYDVGIYNASGSLLNNQGSAVTATGVQTYTLATALNLAAGTYWLAFWCDNATDTVAQRSINNSMDITQGQASVSSHLPATMASATDSGAGGQCPLVIGLLQGGWS